MRDMVTLPWRGVVDRERPFRPGPKPPLYPPPGGYASAKPTGLFGGGGGGFAGGGWGWVGGKGPFRPGPKPRLYPPPGGYASAKPTDLFGGGRGGFAGRVWGRLRRFVGLMGRLGPMGRRAKGFACRSWTAAPSFLFSSPP